MSGDFSILDVELVMASEVNDESSCDKIVEVLVVLGSCLDWFLEVMVENADLVRIQVSKANKINGLKN